MEAVTNLLYLMRTADTWEDVQTFVLQAEAELVRVSDIPMQTLRFHRQQTSPVLSDPEDSIRAVLRLHATRMSARKVQVSLKVRPIPRTALLEGHMRQVLHNLVRNAYEALPLGCRLRVRVRPATRWSTGRHGIHITVADTGTGFLPRTRIHLYEPFHSSTKVTGTGLGLWISKGILENTTARYRCGACWTSARMPARAIQMRRMGQCSYFGFRCRMPHPNQQ